MPVNWKKLELYGRYKTESEARSTIRGLKQKKVKAVFIYEPYNISKYVVFKKNK